MNFPVHGYNECLIMYILAAASPTHGVPAAVYHEGWAQNGAIVDPHKVENIELHLRYQGTEAGPLFWAQYSFLGLDPIGLKDCFHPGPLGSYLAANVIFTTIYGKPYQTDCTLGFPAEQAEYIQRVAQQTVLENLTLLNIKR